MAKPNKSSPARRACEAHDNAKTVTPCITHAHSNTTTSLTSTYSSSDVNKTSFSLWMQCISDLISDEQYKASYQLRVNWHGLFLDANVLTYYP